MRQANSSLLLQVIILFYKGKRYSIAAVCPKHISEMVEPYQSIFGSSYINDDYHNNVAQLQYTIINDDYHNNVAQLQYTVTVDLLMRLVQHRSIQIYEECLLLGGIFFL